jgi:(E)-4-hydroxy-3-methylbut-2-enyl-diphosphate synthase
MGRRLTRSVRVGNKIIGGGAPISVQSMTTTKSTDVAATVSQIKRLEVAGCDIVRVAVPTRAAARAIADIKAHTSLPIVADIHFDYRLALDAIESGADKLRINPGNIGSRDKVEAVAKAAKERGIPIRVGANAGSLDRSKYGAPNAKALVDSALDEVRILENVGFEDVVISVKAFDVLDTIEAYRRVSALCNYPLHLGVTESGLAWEGAIRSAVGLGVLLAEGIGDTLRVSLTADPVEEVKAGIEILAALRLRDKAFTLVSCPTCGRCQIDVIAIADEVRRRLEADPPPRPITVAVMGCVVNGPGEASLADVGIAGGRGTGAIFKRGIRIRSVPESDLVDELMREIHSLESKC